MTLFRIPHRGVEQMLAPLLRDLCGFRDSDGLFHAQHNSRRHLGLRPPLNRGPAHRSRTRGASVHERGRA